MSWFSGWFKPKAPTSPTVARTTQAVTSGLGAITAPFTATPDERLTNGYMNAAAALVKAAVENAVVTERLAKYAEKVKSNSAPYLNPLQYDKYYEEQRNKQRAQNTAQTNFDNAIKGITDLTKESADTFKNSVLAKYNAYKTAYENRWLNRTKLAYVKREVDIKTREKDDYDAMNDDDRAEYKYEDYLTALTNEYTALDNTVRTGPSENDHNKALNEARKALYDQVFGKVTAASGATENETFSNTLVNELTAMFILEVERDVIYARRKEYKGKLEDTNARNAKRFFPDYDAQYKKKTQELQAAYTKVGNALFNMKVKLNVSEPLIFTTISTNNRFTTLANLVYKRYYNRRLLQHLYKEVSGSTANSQATITSAIDAAKGGVTIDGSEATLDAAIKDAKDDAIGALKETLATSRAQLGGRRRTRRLRHRA